MSKNIENIKIPLSFAQQRLWFLDQLEGASAAYNISTTLRLQGMLNLSVFERAFVAIIIRHNVLRTVLVTVNETPAQQILPDLPFAIPVVDLSALSFEQQTDQTKQIATHDAQQPFDLVHGPLLRASLLKLDENDHILLLTMHHIISDSWSLELLLRELASLYTAFIATQPPDTESPLPELPIQYADFSVWQRNLSLIHI